MWHAMMPNALFVNGVEPSWHQTGYTALIRCPWMRQFPTTFSSLRTGTLARKGAT